MLGSILLVAFFPVAFLVAPFVPLSTARGERIQDRAADPRMLAQMP